MPSRKRQGQKKHQPKSVGKTLGGGNVNDSSSNSAAKKGSRNRRRKLVSSQTNSHSRSGQGYGDAVKLEKALMATLQEPKDFKTINTKKKFLYLDSIFELPNLLSAEECAEIIKAAESHGFQHTELKATKWNAFRCNGRTQVISVELARAMWRRCDQHFPEVNRRIPVGLNPNFRLYRYEPNQAFGEHIDESVQVDSYGRGVRTLFTLLVYLNGGGELVGGETKFYKGTKPGAGKVALSFPPKMGSGLAHIHGQRCMLHEGAPVRKGVKYLLRTDVCYKQVESASVP
mmetsp:Transcript_2550/g.5806  ORF Transcript_2550/g.5806 Transcript_2550/m.5806 type:complete len:287 (-) Transcript_2550:87-947(-)